MEVFIALFSAVIGGFAGGWAGAYFQYRKSKVIDKASLMWQFRLKIVEAEQYMWQYNDRTKFEIPIDWLLVAVDDPRISIDRSVLNNYINILHKGWINRLESSEQSNGDCEGINTDILKAIGEAKTNLDRMILAKMKKIGIM